MQYVPIQYIEKQQQQMKPKTTSIQTQRSSYLIANSKGYGQESLLQNNIRGQYNIQDSYQDDILHIQLADSGKNSAKKFYNATSYDVNYSGGVGEGQNRDVGGNNQLLQQQQNSGSKKKQGKQNFTQKKKMWQLQQQLPPKQLGINLVNLNLNFNNNPQSQLPPAYPYVKYQDNPTNQNENITTQFKKKKNMQPSHDQFTNSMKVPQLNYNPNRLQKISNTIQQKSQLQQGQQIQIQQNLDELQIKNYLIDSQQQSSTQRQQNSLDQLNNVISTQQVLANTTNIMNKPPTYSQKISQQAFYQVQDIIPINEEISILDRSESPSARLSNNNITQNILLKSKILKEPNNQRGGGGVFNQNQPPSLLYQNQSSTFQNQSSSFQNQSSNFQNQPYTQDFKQSIRIDTISLDPSLTPKERMERMIKNVDNAATKVLQLQNKQRVGGLQENNKRNGNEQNNKESSKVRNASQEQYDDSSLYNHQYSSLNNNPQQKKNKSGQLAQRPPQSSQSILVHQNSNPIPKNSNNNFYNGIRYEPSSHQFIALKPQMSEEEKMKQSINMQISQIAELEQEQSVELVRNSFVYQKNSFIQQQSKRQASESEPRQFEQNNNYDENITKSFGLNTQQLQLQKAELLNYKNFRTLQNQGSITQTITNTEGQVYDPVYQNADNSMTMPLQENKKTNRKIINANPNLKQDNNSKSNPTNGLVAPRKSVSQLQNAPYLMTQQQKDKLQKNEKDAQLSQKIKIYLDFQRVINFSNNMTMQVPPTNGVKIYKAYITKGNNGVLIRAALKNRWWWSLSEVSEDYENINFLWTQWRKPVFFKIIKNRAELTLNKTKEDGDEDEQNLQQQQQEEQFNNDGNQQIVSNEIEGGGGQTSTSDQSESTANQLGEQQQQQIEQPNLNSSEEDYIDQTKSMNVNSYQVNHDRPGYNEASPSKNLQDYIVKQQTGTKKQNQPQSSPLARKLSSQIKTDDPFNKIAALVNEKDLGYIKKYVKSQKNKKQNNTFAQPPPPVFNKEEYTEGIEKEYEFMREESNNSIQKINIFKNPVKQKMHNHMEYNFHLANKKALYYNMKMYYNITNQNVFDHLPVTFHIQNGLNDPEFVNFTNYYNTFEAENPKRKNVWIIKPGESSNRGNGIQVAGDLNSVKDIIKVKESHQNGFKKTYIIQKYLDRPFLYNKRKFDIRCFMLMTNYNNTMKVYWYTDGYIRTSTKEFTLKNLENRMIHLTNEAVQKRGDDFGKYENGNKLSYAEFQKYIDTTYPKDNFNFMSQVYPQMKKLAYDSVCSVYTKIDKKKRNFSFELFGLDFMIDDSFKTWLIEINTNPSLTIAAPLMSRLLPALIDNVLKIAIDPIFPPPSFPKSKKHLIPESIYENNKFELLFDSEVDGLKIAKLYSNISKKIDEELEEDCKNEEVYDDDDIDVEEEDENEEEGC